MLIWQSGINFDLLFFWLVKDKCRNPFWHLYIYGEIVEVGGMPPLGLAHQIAEFVVVGLQWIQMRHCEIAGHSRVPQEVLAIG